MTKQYVIYHANCDDGFGAAYAVWWHAKRLGLPMPTFIAAQYNEPVPAMEDGSDVLIVDFSYKLPELTLLCERMNTVTIVDHHKTAIEELSGDDAFLIPNLKLFLSDSNSGAVLTWRHINGQHAAVPTILSYIEDRDLWKWQLTDSKEHSAGLSSYPRDFEVWDKLSSNQLINEGRGILRYQAGLVERACLGMRWVHVFGHRVPVVNSSFLQSEIGNRLCEIHEDAPFAAVWFTNSDGDQVWSLRSKDRMDVSELAKKVGGGGHPNAAGFKKRA